MRLASGIVVLALAVPGARADPTPSPVVLPCERLSLGELHREVSHRLDGLQLRLATAEADVHSRDRRHRELERLEHLGHASRVEREAAALEIEVARIRASILQDLVGSTEGFLAGLPDRSAQTAGASPASPGPPVRLKIPGLTRRIGALEFFTLPLPDGWVPIVAEAALPPPDHGGSWPGASLWADRVEALEELGATREAELDSARLHHLAAQTQAWTLASSTRDTARLLQFFRSGSGPWPVTEEDSGPFATSWRLAVPARGPHLGASLALAEAAARHRGALRLRELDEQRAQEIVDVLESSRDRGTSARSSMAHAQAELRAAAARREAELVRIRVREAERDWLRALASGPEAALPQTHEATVAVSSVWILGRLRLLEQQALQAASVREAERRLEHATHRRDQLTARPTRHPRDRQSADREVARWEALRLAGREALELAELELLQWDAVRDLAREDSNFVPPPEVLAPLRTLAEAEAAAAGALVETLLPENALFQDRIQELERLLSRGSARPYELAQARDAARITEAKTQLARVAEAGSLARLDLISVVTTTPSLEVWRPLIARCQSIESEAIPVIADGLEAAASRASRRVVELDRLLRLGHADASEVSRARAQHGAHVWLRAAEDSRESARGLESALFLQAVATLPHPPSRPQVFELPPLE